MASTDIRETLSGAFRTRDPIEERSDVEAFLDVLSKWELCAFPMVQVWILPVRLVVYKHYFIGSMDVKGLLVCSAFFILAIFTLNKWFLIFMPSFKWSFVGVEDLCEVEVESPPNLITVVD